MDLPTSFLIREWFASVYGSDSSLSLSVKDRIAQDKQPHLFLDLKPPTQVVSSPTRPQKQKMVAFVPATPIAKDPDAWKPPGSRSYRRGATPVALDAHGSSQPVSGRRGVDSRVSLGLAAIKKEVTRMGAASSRMIIAGLNEERGNSNDASFYKELEVEKKLWMLTALYNMDKSAEGKSAENWDKDKDKEGKILALFESQCK